MQQLNGMVQTDAGLVVPISAAADLIRKQAEAASGDLRVPHGQKPVEVADEDGRRRIVLTQDEKRLMDRTAKTLLNKGIAYVLVCNQDAPRAEGKISCGQVMRPEAKGTPDFGFGCQCSRIHLRP